jgi:hypothetical protein
MRKESIFEIYQEHHNLEKKRWRFICGKMKVSFQNVKTKKYTCEQTCCSKVMEGHGLPIKDVIFFIKKNEK